MADVPNPPDRENTAIRHTTSMFSEEEIPGTETIYTHDAASGVILLPQPTSSPDDPLNWSPFRKHYHALVVCFVTGLTAATSNDAGAAQDQMNEELGISFANMNEAAGLLFIGVGYFCLFLAPMATLYGRRIGYLLCMMFGLVGAIWFGRIKGPRDSIGNQLFVGMSESCAEALVQLSLTDIYFEHQRGSALGMYILATSIGTYLGPLIGGYVVAGMGWRWIGWWGAIWSAFSIGLIYFTLEETYFDRDKVLAEESGVNSSEDEKNALEKRISRGSSRRHERKPSTAGNRAQPDVQVQGKTYWERIALITPCTNLKGFGTYQYFQRLIHGLRVFAFPAVIFSGLQWGAQDAWLSFYLTTEDDDWYGPPWNYTDKGVALMNVPCVIGAIIGCMYAGPISDTFVMWMARRNKGVKEAEYRLWLGLANLVVSPLGLFLFGYGTAKGMTWPVPYFGLGLIGFGWGCAGDIAMAYLVDCYPEMVIEGMVGVAVINNTIACVWTFACESFLEKTGTLWGFSGIAIMEFFCVLLTVPMLIWGKRIRKWTKPSYEKFLIMRDGL